jgi:hypothetical protein
LKQKNNNFRQLFGAGTARGGTGLVVQTLRANPNIELAMEPFLLLFKHLRTAFSQRLVADDKTNGYVSLLEPLSSLYFNDRDIAYTNYVLGNPADEAITPGQLMEILNGFRDRAKHDAVDIIPFVDLVSGSTFVEVLNSMLIMVQHARGRNKLSWCGFLENWCVEFFPFLANFFPEARFFIVVRDPRAVLCSALNAPLHLQATLFSYLRSMRKLLNLAMHFSGDDRFKGRLCIVKYEALVTNPESISMQLCDFLGTIYDPKMIDPDSHVVPGSTSMRDGQSTFEANAVGYNPLRASRWQSILEPELVEITNACLAPELELFGYLNAGEAPKLTLDLVCKVLSSKRVLSSQQAPSWTIDMSSLAADYGAEMLRSQWKADMHSGGLLPERLQRECFLTDRVESLISTQQAGGEVLPDWRSFDRLIKV